MTTINAKTLAGAGNTNEGVIETGNDSDIHNLNSLELRRAIGKVQAAISDNNRLLRKISEKSVAGSPSEFWEFDVQFGQVQEANAALTMRLRDLVEECHRAVQQERVAVQERKEEDARRDARRREIIARITGHSDWSPIDLKYVLVERYREGGDYMAVLDAMKAIDDLDLERAGLNSWGEGDE